MGNRAPRCIPDPPGSHVGLFSFDQLTEGIAMDRLRLGILFSMDGPYGVVGRDCRDGAELALAPLAAKGRVPVRIETVLGDPACAGTRYVDLAGEMLRQRGCRPIIGTVSSLATTWNEESAMTTILVEGRHKNG